MLSSVIFGSTPFRALITLLVNLLNKSPGPPSSGRALGVRRGTPYRQDGGCCDDDYDDGEDVDDDHDHDHKRVHHGLSEHDHGDDEDDDDDDGWHHHHHPCPETLMFGSSFRLFLIPTVTLNFQL